MIVLDMVKVLKWEFFKASTNKRDDDDKVGDDRGAVVTGQLGGKSGI